MGMNRRKRRRRSKIWWSTIEEEEEVGGRWPLSLPVQPWGGAAACPGSGGRWTAPTGRREEEDRGTRSLRPLRESQGH